MTIALLFGLIDNWMPEIDVSYKRLHIFFFNLCVGGALILYHTEGQKCLSKKVWWFYIFSLAYAVCAAVGAYIPVLILSVPLLGIVEYVRNRHFSFLPLNFFSTKASLDKKFNHASLLCLSSAIVVAALVILNNEYLKLFYYKKLTLDTFFLGYSFPISLITMSIMFYFMAEEKKKLIMALKEASFWLVNVGVVVFFIFILLEMTLLEIISATILLITVCVIFYIFKTTARDIQQKSFLLSGMTFLLFTGVTGIFYIMRYFLPVLEPYDKVILNIHAMVSLYGWNLSGLFVIMRWRDFPIRLSSRTAIALHWCIVFILAPLGKYVLVCAIIAIPLYILLLKNVFLSKEGVKENVQ
jgi:hypothetical protein